MTAPAIDATKAGQVLLWAPEGAGDFADLAWVIASVLGNRAGVRGIDVHRACDGQSLHAQVDADDVQYVRDTGAALGWSVCEPDDTYCNVWGVLGDVHVIVTWLAPQAADAASESREFSDLDDEEAGS